MAQIRPDAVAVQEITPEQARALGEVLPFGGLSPSNWYVGMGIALRQPGRVRTVGLGYREAWIAEVTSGNGTAIELVNVHIRAPHQVPLRHTFRLRREQLRAIERHVAESPLAPRALIGDFNATSRWPLYRRLARQFTDAAVASARRNGKRPQPTWRPFSRFPPILRIDHVFVRGLEVHDLQVIAIAGSDHCAVVADVRPSLPSSNPAEDPPS